MEISGWRTTSTHNEARRKSKRSIGQKTLKFGAGERFKSKGEYNLPAAIAGKEVTIKTDVESDIPLLLSKQAMKTAGVKMDFDIPLLLSKHAMKTAGVKMDLESDTAQIFDKDIALNLTTSGYYCIPIDRAEKIPVQKMFLVDLEEMPSKDRYMYKTLFKLHRQFAHPPIKKLKSLLQDADQWKDEYSNLLEDIGNTYELCKWYAETPSRPVVGLPVASQFNEKVLMDLKQWNGYWILRIIDMWSRYTVSVFINRKKPSDVIDALMQRWIAVFGTMGSIMTDNGGELSSDEMREVASILNVRLITMASDSPFQNGLCERVHSVTDMMLLKLMEENKKTESQTLLSWANMARNTLQMWNGFSSH